MLPMVVPAPTWSAKVDEILSGVEDENLRIDVAGVVRHALFALDALSHPVPIRKFCERPHSAERRSLASLGGRTD